MKDTKLLYSVRLMPDTIGIKISIEKKNLYSNWCHHGIIKEFYVNLIDCHFNQSIIFHTNKHTDSLLKACTQTQKSFIHMFVDGGNHNHEFRADNKLTQGCNFKNFKNSNFMVIWPQEENDIRIYTHKIDFFICFKN